MRMRGGLRRALCATTAMAMALLLAVAGSADCATSNPSNHRRPRALALASAALALGGSGVWVVGERRAEPGSMPAVGLGIVAVGIAGMIASGAWKIGRASCRERV